LPEDRHIWQEHQKNSLIGHIPGEVQFRIKGKNGTVRWIEHACQPVIDDTGRFLGLRGSNRDISDRKQAEKALRQKEAELRENRDYIRDLTNSLPDSVYSVSMPERTIEWGNEAVRQLGYEVEECVGRTTEFLYATKEDYLAYGEKLAQAFAAGKDTFETEVLFRKKSGEVFPAEVRVSLFRLNGRLVRVTGIVKDISERKKKEHELERYQQRLKALTSQLTIAEENERRSIAADLHDHVGQSLALARMQIASVRKRVTEPGQTAVLDEISDTLHQTLHQTRELIYELSPPQLNEIGLSAAIREWLEEQVEKRQGIQTECIDNGPELKLEQDLRAILFRCVRELLTNVVKHAQATRVKVHVNRVNDLLEIIISDNGCGFDAGATEQFLTPKGGFGLFSVRERMADFGGAAEISSEPGQGTQVILRVPVK
jgi:PAS domain S-box-containing protein